MEFKDAAIMSMPSQPLSLRFALSGFTLNGLGLGILVAAAMAGVFAFDLATERGVAGGVPYVAVVCLAFVGSNRRWIWTTAVCCTFLTIIAAFMSPSGGELWKVTLNRLLALFAIGATATLGDIVKRSLGQLRKLNQTLSLRSKELAKLNADLRRANTTLEGSNQELEQFAYIASHDLQEPLRKISAYAELINEECGEQLTDDGKKYLSIVIDGAQRLKQLVSDLLTFSRITTRGQKPAASDANVALKEAVNGLEIAILENEANVTFDKLPVVHADASQLTLLFQNLLCNAIKYRSDDPPRIHVGVREADDNYEFCVKDNGIGIEPQYSDKIFEIFQRLHSRQERGGGTGIGLANCKRIVERIDGRIWVDSIPGKGSAFYFTINKGARERD